ncbi:MAG: hypothetical protein Q8O48_07045, partial [Anaerolineales bacterium]|nr:hypothetical protein [Anaerolineales bacterium]
MEAAYAFHCYIHNRGNIIKKILLPILSLFLMACASPQVTVTFNVTVTSPPPTATVIPTPTLHPRFIEIQDQV